MITLTILYLIFKPILSVLLTLYLGVKLVQIQFNFEKWLMKRAFNKVIQKVEKYHNDFITKHEGEIILNKLLSNDTFVGDYVIYKKDLGLTFHLQEFSLQCDLLHNFENEIKSRNIKFNSSESGIFHNYFLNRNKEFTVLHIYV